MATPTKAKTPVRGRARDPDSTPKRPSSAAIMAAAKARARGTATALGNPPAPPSLPHDLELPTASGPVANPGPIGAVAGRPRGPFTEDEGDDRDHEDHDAAPIEQPEGQSGPHRAISLDETDLPKPDLRNVDPRHFLRGREPNKLGRLHNMDRDQDEPLMRLRMAEAKRRRRRADNIFLTDHDDPSGFPQLPNDDPEWSYKWIRWQIPPERGGPKEVDTSNLQDSTTGRLPYEYVRMDQLPERWQNKLMMHRVIEGRYAGNLVHKDLIAGRTPRYLRDMQVDAYEFNAEEQRADLLSSQQEAMRRRHLRPRGVVDEEDRGFADEIDHLGDYEV